MPNGTLRPACTFENSPPPSNTVLVDSTRSAAPPIIVGANSPNAAITFCPAERVAISSPALNLGSASRQPSRSRLAHASSQSAAISGKASRQASKRSRHSACSEAPRSRSDMCSYTRSSTQKRRSGSNPITCLVARTSSSPSAAPCDFAVSTACGAG